MTNLLLESNAWIIFDGLVDSLIPIGICVVLPLILVSLVIRARKHEVDKKTEVMLKAIENGAQLDPAFFQQVNRRSERTVKDKLMGYLITACITSGIGLLAGIVFTILTTMNSKPSNVILLCILPCAVLLAVGIAFFIVYFVSKKQIWAKELAELDEKH